MTERLTMRETAIYQPTDDELIALIRELGCGEDDALETPEEGCHNKVRACGDIIIRYPKDEAGVAALLAEYALLEELDGRGAPRAIMLVDRNGTPVAFTERIYGVHIDNVNELAPEKIEELAWTVAEFHTATSDYFSNKSGEEPMSKGTHGAYLQAMVRESVTDRLEAFHAAGVDFFNYPDAPAIFRTGLQKLDEILAEHPDDFSGTQFSRLHHDLNPGNIFLTHDGVILIDFNVTYGDPRDDINYLVSNNGGSPAFQEALLAAYERATGIAISPVQMEAYTLKNWLDDLAWTIEMCEKYKHDEKLYEKYRTAYDVRLAALQELLLAELELTEDFQ